MRSRSVLAVLVLFAWPAFAEPPAQGYLRAAAKLYQALEYEKALEQLQRAKKVAAGVDDDLQIGLWEGILFSELSRGDDARAAFNTALALKAEAALPVKVSPKVSGVFEKLKAEAQKELAKNPPPPPAPVATPLPSLPDEPPPSPPPAVVVAPPPDEKPAPSARRFALIPFYVAGAGAIAGIVGAVGANDAAGRLKTQTFKSMAEGMGVRDTGAAFQTVGFVGLGVAAVGVVAGTLMLLLIPGDPAPIVLSVTPSGAAVALHLELP